MSGVAEVIGRTIITLVDLLLPRIAGADDRVKALRWVEGELGKKAANIEAQLAHEARLRATGQSR